MPPKIIIKKVIKPVIVEEPVDNEEERIAAEQLALIEEKETSKTSCCRTNCSC